MVLFIYLTSSGKSLHTISVEWFLLAVTLAASLCFELIGERDEYYQLEPNMQGYLKDLIKPGIRRKKLFFLLVEISMTIAVIVCFSKSNVGLFLLPFAVLDTIIFLHLPFYFSLLIFPGGFINTGYFIIYSVYCLFIIIIYYQNYIIIDKYRKYLEDFEQKEYQLKDSINSQSALYKNQLEQSSLTFENKMLEEKARLSQALHDKLGHSINGSVYQLEACKVLMDKDPKESVNIIQAVIDNLRTSMDEIRNILRREKPDKKRMAYLQLVKLCEDCKEKYGIAAEVTVDGEDKKIPEAVWDAILDNAIEAVTNALKYAACTELSIKIVILHKVVRCSIDDNGTGCKTIKEGMGIQGMKSRARKVNGYIDINSEDGFHINMIIPLEKQET